MDRESQKNWDRENMATLTCRVTKKKADEFKKACAELETNMNAVFLSAISKTIQDAKKENG